MAYCHGDLSNADCSTAEYKWARARFVGGSEAPFRTAFPAAEMLHALIAALQSKSGAAACFSIFKYICLGFIPQKLAERSFLAGFAMQASGL